jgi:hypothetical protein
MKFSLKNYKLLKTKKYIKNTNLFFVINGINTNSKDSTKIQQELTKINFNCYKIFNKTSTKILEDSIYKNSKYVINGLVFFVKSKKHNKIVKKTLFNNFESLKFIFLKIKLNNKIYSLNQLKNVNIFNYNKKKLLFYQFTVIHLKHYILLP